MKNSTHRAIRWGELLAPLEAKAQEEGATVSALVRRVMRSYLELDNEAPRKGVLGLRYLGRRDRGILSRYGTLSVRAGRVGVALEKRAQEEKTTTSEIVRRAIRLYLANEDLPSFRQFEQELHTLQNNLARIGGNLNQIALHMNMTDILREKDLGQVHIALIHEFKEVVNFYKMLEKQFAVRIY